MRVRVDPNVGHLAAWIATQGQALSCDYQQAQAFLQTLDPRAESFSFRTFSECHYTRQPGDDPLERAIHADLESCWSELTDLNCRGAAISVTINRTNGDGRAAEDIVAVRALFLDDDRAGEIPRHFGLPPQIQVETSPRRFHHYWLVEGLPLTDFSDLQRELAQRFDGDHRVAALNQSMQLPGCWRRKNLHQPRLPSIRRLRPISPYSPEQIERSLLARADSDDSALAVGEKS